MTDTPTMPPLPQTCECDQDVHADTPCVREPDDQGTVRSSPALCIPCLFMCWNDDEW